MRRFDAFTVLVFVLGVILAIASCRATLPQTKRLDVPDPVILRAEVLSPQVITQKGEITWIQCHMTSSYCPGDPLGGHGGEALGGPDATQTWCFEQGYFDSCGTCAPWVDNCFDHTDVRSEPSPSGINYWHVDTYRADQRIYCGNHVLWCGTDGTWGGAPVDCGTWISPPGYGNEWNCVAELNLPTALTGGEGCFLYFDLRYDTECKRDYFYVEFYSPSGWETLATFNATSNNPGPECGPLGPNPDYWGNTDTGQPFSCDWQERNPPTEPAFHASIPAYKLPEAEPKWWLRDPTTHPPGRFDHGIACDKVRGRVVIFGGIGIGVSYLDDTWEWDGDTWQQLSPGNHPCARGGCQMVFDEAREQVVLFGGMEDTSGLRFGDTWVWDGTDWTELSPAHSPQARFGHGMTYDSLRERVVLFGGLDSTAFQNDTWEWDGLDWVEIMPDTQPDARYFLGGNGLAYDGNRNVVILFGGSEGGTNFKDDTWEYEGTTWIPKSPGNKPSSRDAHALVYYPHLGGTILFGGNHEGDMLNDTWKWNGTSWTWVSVYTPAPERHRHAMVYDEDRARIVLFGGWKSGRPPYYDTQELALHRHLRFRWRFVSDPVWSDADRFGDTDGGAFIDNIWVVGEHYSFVENFETGNASPILWSFPTPDGVADAWHLAHDPDPPYEGADGGDRTSCVLDSSWVWRARPERGYPGGAEWRNGWHYRLISPSISIQNTGCVVQYDRYMCTRDYTCDYTDSKVRFYDSGYGRWCPWMNIDNLIFYGGCSFWDRDLTEDVSALYGPTADAVQFAWDLMDLSSPSDYCRGKHSQTDNMVDNVSVGFYDASATAFATMEAHLFQDTFHDSICGYSSYFDVYNTDTIAYYSGPTAPPLPQAKQPGVEITDKDGLLEARLYGSIDKGAYWNWIPMNLWIPLDVRDPALGGWFNGTLCASDFGLPKWNKGTEVWYYIKATDELLNDAYLPAAADPESPHHTGGREDYYGFSVLPMAPPGYTGVKVLLVDGFGRRINDWAECMADAYNISVGIDHGLEDIYEQTLVDAGYCYDKYDIGSPSLSIHIHPVEYGS